MIHDVLLLLVDRLNEQIRRSTDWSPEVSGEDTVVLPDGQSMDPLSFKIGAITGLLINLEEENLLRSSDPYRRPLMDGQSMAVQPPIRLRLYVLFVARFPQYDQGLRYLSLILRYFQNHRVLDHQNAPGLPAEIDHLHVELVTLPFAEQNEVWNALRTTYHPSVLYRVSLIVYRDAEGMPVVPMTDADSQLEGV